MSAEQEILRIYGSLLGDPAISRINFEYRGLTVDRAELQFVHRNTTFSVSHGERAGYHAATNSLHIPVAYYERWGPGSIRNIGVHELVHGIQDRYPQVTNGWRVWEIELTAMLAQAIVQIHHRGRSSDHPFPALYELLETRHYNGRSYFELPQGTRVRFSESHLERIKPSFMARRLPDGRVAYPNAEQIYSWADGLR